MERGTYVAASSGLMQFRKLEVATNNLSNVNTPGFKKQALTSTEQSFDATFASYVEREDPFARPDHDRAAGAVNLETVTDFSVGSIRSTDNPLDVALRNPNDFFVVNTPEGDRYTRAGNFTLGKEGQLVTQDGNPVLGDGGPLTVDGGGAAIGPDGGVFANGISVGRLRVVRFEDPSGLSRVDGARFQLGSAKVPAEVEPEVVPQSLEMANVSVISGVVDLITANRAFQMYTKTAETIDSLNQTAINQIGRRLR